ncbi:hypothetical protein GCM10010275_62500 [Streptomyces litmocidini]|uniref:hypothetical protein n=1 Tax=Streptomyces litmocidini TaxID=67318 RepID=UPI00167EA947|nr:hypothetical protein [Streptomyces litmocidini]GGV12952.1 hypothetical protein GCM10010275_62500 [Streptomyces litmocidini]
MRPTAHSILLPVAALAMATAGCTSGSDDAAPQGQPASEVCGGFAREPDAASALEAIAGKDVRLTADRSDPERVLGELRKAARTPQGGKQRMEGIPFCTLEAAGDEKNVLNITLREALAVPTGEAAKTSVTAYSTGRLATSSDLFASVYFTCRMPAPAHEIVLDAELERADENEADHAGIRDEQITLANAAARHVAAELGCTGTGLVRGVPAKARR